MLLKIKPEEVDVMTKAILERDPRRFASWQANDVLFNRTFSRTRPRESKGEEEEEEEDVSIGAGIIRLFSRPARHRFWIILQGGS